MANTLATVAEVLSILEKHGAPCHVFGGWAEEILGLRAPWHHADIDLVYLAESFLLLDAAIAGLQDLALAVPEKRFNHKRAFIFRETLCEIILVKDGKAGPVTNYWGDTVFRWNAPLLHPEPFSFCHGSFTVISGENLRKHRDEKKSRQPHRWSEPTSFDAS
ncbi:hypothetical protein [Neorhizobium galegae]|uniref:hypothetical protein n=1 Tax=Neorhizobium galegae TaxID=399 RepID=UPI0021029113|nr:hypothetical protein [Neorhizobium galegae]MCQ1853215.1 hypothetical protein [Neorhizobium galegae]